MREKFPVVETILNDLFAKSSENLMFSIFSIDNTVYEIKKSSIGEGTKINHLSYVGDSALGKNINIGAGTITANFDGKNKHRTIIDDYSKTGANSVLVAPIKIGAHVTIGAGSTISKDIPDKSLVVERSKAIIRTKTD